MTRPERKIAQRSQERFRFYMASLTFTLLAAAIQTAKFSDSHVSDGFELAGWVCLLVSGIMGLWSLESYPTVYVGQAVLQDHIAALDDEQGNSVSGGIVEQYNEDSEKLRKVSKITQAKYRAHKCLFVIGLILVVASRAYLPLTRILVP